MSNPSTVAGVAHVCLLVESGWILEARKFGGADWKTCSRVIPFQIASWWQALEFGEISKGPVFRRKMQDIAGWAKTLGSVCCFFSLVVSFLRQKAEVIWDDPQLLPGRGASAKSSGRTRETSGAGASGYPEFVAESGWSLNAQTTIWGGQGEPMGTLWGQGGYSSMTSRLFCWVQTWLCRVGVLPSGKQSFLHRVCFQVDIWGTRSLCRTEQEKYASDLSLQGCRIQKDHWTKYALGMIPSHKP